MTSRLLAFIGLPLLLASIGQVVAGPVPTGKPSSYPDWWFERDVIPRRPDAPARQNGPLWPDDYPTADDFAVVNGGQLRHIAVKAVAEFQAVLPAPGAGGALETELAKWTATPPNRDDYAAINQGQLKYVVSLFYDRLFTLGYTGKPLIGSSKYPWTTSVATDNDDFALVNLGQLKLAFSFRAPGGSGDAADTDLDGLGDAWELSYWPSIATQSGAVDGDGDGASNLTEFLQGRNPIAGVIVHIPDPIGLVVHLPE